MATSEGWTDRGKAKLESSGLTRDIAKKLGMYEAPSAKLLNDRFDAVCSLVIPYFDLDGKPLTQQRTGEQFYRVRYLDSAKDFTAVAQEKPSRYEQPPHTLPEAYFPKLMDWRELAKNANKPLVLTEGELKAAAACLQGFPTIGLGGVWSFRSAKEGIFFLPQLKKINWRCRKVYICFDSDYASNPNICHAMNALCKELEEHGAYVYAIILPQLDKTNKTGLDDYFLECSDDDFRDLMMAADEIGMVRTLWQTNEEVTYVTDPGMVIVQATGQKMSVSNFTAHSQWATLSTPKKMIAPDGSLVIRKACAAKEWIVWPFRHCTKRITFAPGKPRVTDRGEYNIWAGWGVQPIKGDVQPWLDLTKFVFDDMDKGALEYFYDWCAYQFQNPGVKMFVAVVVHGLTQGTGKSLIGYTLGEIFGQHFKELTEDDLELTYWAENKQFVLGDEVTGTDNRKHQSLLKRLISQRSVSVNIKFVPQYEVPDRINYYFTAQHADSFFLEDRDRRFFIVECQAQLPLSDEFYTSYKKWLWEENGAAHLFQWLLDRKISKTFNPHAPAMPTKAKDRMIQIGKSDLSLWIYNLLRNPDDYLVFGQMKYTRDLFSAKELVNMYRVENPESKVTPNGMTRALKNGGAHWCAGGQMMKGPDGKMERFFAVRNIEYWSKQKVRGLMERHLQSYPTATKKVAGK